MVKHMSEAPSGINRDGSPIGPPRRPDLRVSERDPARADQETYSSLLRSLDLARDDQSLFHRDEDGNLFISRGRREKGKPVLAKDILQERFTEAYRLSDGSLDVIDRNLKQLRVEVVLERKVIGDAKRELRKKAREKYAPHSRRDKDKVEEWYQAALTGGQFQAFEDQVRKKQLIINVLAGKSQALKGKQERDKAVAEYRKFFRLGKDDKNPSASQLSLFITEQKARREALGPQVADLERQRRAGEILRRIALRKESLTRQLEFRLSSLGHELQSVLRAMRRNALQTVLTAGLVFTLGYGVGRLITMPAVPYEQTPIYKITQLIDKYKDRYLPGSQPRIETPGLAGWELVSPTATFEPVKSPTKIPPSPTEPVKVAQVEPTAIPPTPTREPTSTAVPTRTSVPASPTAAPTREPSPTAIRPPATATREPQPNPAPTKTETTVTALAAADKKTREAVIATTEAYPGIEGVRKLKIPKPANLADLDAEKLVYNETHPVNIIEFDYNWVNATRSKEDQQKYYMAYATGVSEALPKMFDVNRHLTVILEPGHQSVTPAGLRTLDTGSVVTLANGQVAVEKKYNLETAKVIAKELQKAYPNWTVIVTVDEKGFEVQPLATYAGKSADIDNPDAFAPLRFAENQIPGTVVRLSLHYNGAAANDEKVNRRGGDVIPPAVGIYREDSIKLAKLLAE